MAATEDESVPTATQRLNWPFLDRLPQRLAADPLSAPLFRDVLREAQQALAARFHAEEPVESIVRARADLIDVVLRAAWNAHLGDTAQRWSLVAVGGYGRSELHPYSDVDVLILVPEGLTREERGPLERLLAFLWDIGLEIGHSVRTVAECASESATDVSVMTTLIEARLLAGDGALLAAMREALEPQNVWPVREFFEAKVREQAARHAKANDTAYNLEPNVKTGPGGLRDIQTIAWVARRHFDTATLDELVTHGFLAPSELRKLKQARAFLWRVRCALHLIAGRREDRLLFDHQVRLAQSFGYEDASYTLAVEQFMQRYYRTVMDVSLLNELLLQLFREAILTAGTPPQPLNPRFQVRNDYLEAISDDLFARTPSALLELFVLLQQHPQIRGVRAETIRAIGRSLWLIDEEFRQNPRHHRLFLEILRAPVGVTHELRRMNNYGVLGRYIPAFGRIVGRMQYDLFHAYTVDAHTLFVVSNLRRLAIERYNHELPQVSQVFAELPKPELAYLAALFHDIAKGRGGDHSELGSVDAEAFCLEQGLSRYDARLVAWLVRNHLILSVTAQKQDISEPEVINAFARRVGDETHLNYLYVLTCADVRGTDPKLWNSWKATLFHEFYERTRRALRRGLESPIDQDELIRETQEAARAALRAAGITDAQVDAVWSRLSDGYFLRSTPEEVTWHTRLLADRDPRAEDPVVALDAQSLRGTTAIFAFAPLRRHGFARTTAVLDQLGLTIVGARITPTEDGYSLDLYHVLEDDGAPITDKERLLEIERALWHSLHSPEEHPLAVSRRAPRQSRMFSTPTHILLSTDEHHGRSVLELTAADRPGLLCDVGKVLMEERLHLHNARIMTVGERAEDVFYITDSHNRPLDSASADRLQQRLTEVLERRRAA
ncbi:MAG TPA: [protein-PII] uridylyltransferase [Steroidobacteraceae bacterium]|nr:[protein-PII] uridylyltransferase [Steroidobacteraceae bacterium]HNS28398.1 [protein-PII] uridylyltransferase [Steroidobacteraceae bacterium]